jgi:hypothetical protein
VVLLERFPEGVSLGCAYCLDAAKPVTPVARALTPHQRDVFMTLTFTDMPIDVLAERLGMTRAAVYETLRKARGLLGENLLSVATTSAAVGAHRHVRVQRVAARVGAIDRGRASVRERVVRHPNGGVSVGRGRR